VSLNGSGAVHAFDCVKRLNGSNLGELLAAHIAAVPPPTGSPMTDKKTDHPTPPLPAPSLCLERHQRLARLHPQQHQPRIRQRQGRPSRWRRRRREWRRRRRRAVRSQQGLQGAEPARARVPLHLFGGAVHEGAPHRAPRRQGLHQRAPGCLLAVIGRACLRADWVGGKGVFLGVTSGGWELLSLQAVCHLSLTTQSTRC
jgi:hypothetical protein